MNLSLRLTEVKNTVISCGTACDVGCDHGFVAISLVKEGTAKNVIACDINKGPLQAAKDNIAKEGLSEKIETRLSDGLKKVNVSDSVNAIIIAGMGGALMTKILSEGLEVVKASSQLVLQPQSELFLVRIWLRENGYIIVKEKMLFDMGKPYFIMDARPGEPVLCPPDIQRIYDLYSEYLIKNKDPQLKEYLENGLKINKGYLEGIDPSKADSLTEKIRDIEKALTMMEVF